MCHTRDRSYVFFLLSIWMDKEEATHTKHGEKLHVLCCVSFRGTLHWVEVFKIENMPMIQ